MGPYIAVGPAIVLTALTDAPIKKAAGPFKLGLQNIGLLLAAFDFGRTPPLDGGGIYRLGLVYGGGIKYRVHPRITVGADFRETWSPNPQFITDSYTQDFFTEDGYNSEVARGGTTSKYRQHRFTLGIAFTF